MNSLLVLALLATATVLAAPNGKRPVEKPENLMKKLYKAETSLSMQRKFLEKFDDVSDEMYGLIIKSIRNTGLDLQVLASQPKTFELASERREFAPATCQCPANHDCIDGNCIPAQSVCPVNCPPDWACINGKCINGSK